MPKFVEDPNRQGPWEVVECCLNRKNQSWLEDSPPVPRTQPCQVTLSFNYSPHNQIKTRLQLVPTSTLIFEGKECFYFLETNFGTLPSPQAQNFLEVTIPIRS